jgi:hypothetical protein
MINLNKKDAWVGFFDILGFKNLSRQTEESHRKLLESQLNDLLKPLESDLKEYGQVERIVFSDTLVVSAPWEARFYGWFCSQCQKMMHESIYIGLPLRGAISVGTVFISTDPPIVIGLPAIEAYEYCVDQNWIGLLLTPSATTALRQVGLEPLHHDFVSDDIPLRNKSAENVLAYRFQNGMSNYESSLLFLLQEMKHSASDKYKEKYDNTITFMKKHYQRIEYIP